MMENTMRDEIAKVAYDLYEKSGRAAGRDTQNWLEAEKIVRARYEKEAGKDQMKKSPRSAVKGKK